MQLPAMRFPKTMIFLQRTEQTPCSVMFLKCAWWKKASELFLYNFSERPAVQLVTFSVCLWLQNQVIVLERISGYR